MDLHPIPGATPSAAETQAIDAALGPPEQAGPHLAFGGLERAQRRRTLLLPVLNAVQDAIGWLSPGAMNHLCRRLDVPPAEAYGVATFYALLATEPGATRVAHVCDDIVCRMNGGRELCAELERHPELASAVRRSPCLGQCERGPAVLFQIAGLGACALAPASAAEVRAVLGGAAPPGVAATRPRSEGGLLGGSAAAVPGPPAHAPGPGGAARSPAAAAPGLGRAAGPGTVTPGPGSGGRPAAYAPGPGGARLLRRVGRIDPARLDDYRAHGGYRALRRALELGPAGVIREVTDSKLLGRGGAAFPAGRKWEAVARAPVHPHYVVGNADESEPGTFKDRLLMEEDPYALVEAMTIAGWAVGGARGWIYVRGEYPLAAARLEHAIRTARARGYLGADVMGSGFGFDLEVRRGAGAYICGEETALFNSVEGLRGEPRNKPPYPVEHGLFGKPTLVNNVETLANVLDIVLEGGPAFAAIGTAQSTGPKLFCLSGCVARPGVYEVPFGATLRELIAMAGGVRDGRALRAVLLGGAAGTFVTPAEIDLPLTFEGTRAAGASLGSGVVMLFDDQADLADTVLRIAAFFRDESCGQCVPCRVGTERQEEVLRRLASGKTLGSAQDEVALFDDIAQAMRDASICGLGHTASWAAQSAIRKLGLFGGGR